MAYTLISHQLCPYVQRAAIALTEKGLPFERVNVDLANKPDWFLRLSPLGKTPLLLVRDDSGSEEVLFESAIIADYLDEVHPPRLHPEDALARARHRAWVEYASALLNTIWGFYTAPDAQALSRRADELRAMFATLEGELAKHAGPLFAEAGFSLVDAAFGPVFRYFDVFETIRPFGFFEHTPRVRAWRAALAQRASVQAAVTPDYSARLRRFIAERGSELSRLQEQAVGKVV
jgi:glutathione S-transferase